jgi:hypothetical protein
MSLMASRVSGFPIYNSMARSRAGSSFASIRALFCLRVFPIPCSFHTGVPHDHWCRLFRARQGVVVCEIPSHPDFHRVLNFESARLGGAIIRSVTESG